jgi:cytochrome c oxidase cbb3-type subunit 1
VHSGALGWNGMITFGAIYYLVPKLWGRERLYSLRMVNWHFWLATLGIVFYAASMWVAGIMQGLMWREYGPTASWSTPSPKPSRPCSRCILMRAFGGLLYLAGA